VGSITYREEGVAAEVADLLAAAAVLPGRRLAGEDPLSLLALEVVAGPVVLERRARPQDGHRLLRAVPASVQGVVAEAVEANLLAELWGQPTPT